MTREFEVRLKALDDAYNEHITRPNKIAGLGNGVYNRYINPILTAAHAPVSWRYDLNPETNPYLMERFGINAVFNAGAIKWQGKYLLMARVEGVDRKSFFAIAESPNGIDNFTFWEKPVAIPETDDPDTNIYDIRLTEHADGWIYGLFCTERRDPNAPAYDQSMAVAECGIARTKDMVNWQRLPDLKTPSPQQRNVVLHPEFVDGKYAFYTRPQDSFINAGKGVQVLARHMFVSLSIIKFTIRFMKPRTARALLQLKRIMGGCTWRTACATQRQDYGMCFMFS